MYKKNTTGERGKNVAIEENVDSALVVTDD